MRIFSIILFLVLTPALFGEVYLLRNFRRGKNDRGKVELSDGFFHSMLDFKPMFEEDIRINGADGRLSVGLLDNTYADILRAIQYTEAKGISYNDINMVIKTGSVRYLIYNTGDFSKAVCFAFNVPQVKNPPPLPANFPDPGNNAVHDKIVEFPDRKTVYVTFAAVLDAEDAFYNCKSWLQAQDFNHIDNGDNSNAGFFLSKDSSKIVLVSFSEKYNNGFVYFKERKK